MGKRFTLYWYPEYSCYYAKDNKEGVGYPISEDAHKSQQVVDLLNKLWESSLEYIIDYHLTHPIVIGTIDSNAL